MPLPQRSLTNEEIAKFLQGSQPHPDFIGDVHRLTVYHDATFHAYMDALAGNPVFGISRNWRSWGFRRVRMYAKRWNFTKLYGMPSHVLRDTVLGRADTGRLYTTEPNIKERS